MKDASTLSQQNTSDVPAPAPSTEPTTEPSVLVSGEYIVVRQLKTTEQPEILNVRLALNEEEAHGSDGSNNESDISECDSE